MQPTDTAPDTKPLPEALENVDPKDASPEQLGEIFARELLEQSTADTVDGMEQEVRGNLREIGVMSASGKDIPATPGPWEDEVAAANAAVDRFKKNATKLKIGHRKVETMERGTQAYTKKGGTDADTRENRSHVAELIEGEQAVEGVELTEKHEEQHVEDPGLGGTVYLGKGTAKVNEFQRTEGKAEFYSAEIVKGSGRERRPNAPGDYADAHENTSSWKKRLEKTEKAGQFSMA